MAVGKLAEKILAAMEVEGKNNRKVDKNATDNATKGRKGQILYIDPAVWTKTILDLFPSLDPAAIKEIWQGYDNYWKDLKRVKDLPIARVKELKAERARLWKKGLIPQGQGYLVLTYDQVRKQKNKDGELGRLIKPRLKKGGAGRKDTNALKRLGGKDYSKEGGGDLAGAQAGHQQSVGAGGRDSKTGKKERGVGGAAAKVLNAERIVAQSKTALKQTRFEKAVTTYKNTLNLTIKHDQVWTKDGKLRKSYVPVLSWQESVENQRLKSTEEAAYKAFVKEMEDLARMPGSTPMDEALAKTTLHRLSPKNSKGKGHKRTSKGDKASQIKEKSTGKARRNKKLKSTTSLIRDSGVGVASIKSLASRKNKQAPSKVSPFSYMAMINKKLPETVRKNMGDPGLQNRTGRFANSVKVQDVNMTQQGHPSFGYTYAKNPYQIFEVGDGSAPWANSQRDPRKLIDRSIREVAAELAIGRFYTRRL